MEDNPYESPQTKPIPRLSVRRVIANGLIFLALPMAGAVFLTTTEIALPITAQFAGDRAERHANAVLTVAGSGLVGLMLGGTLFWSGMHLRDSSNQP